MDKNLKLQENCFNVNKQTLSTCVGDMRGACPPLNGKSWKGYAFFDMFTGKL